MNQKQPSSFFSPKTSYHLYREAIYVNKMKGFHWDSQSPFVIQINDFESEFIPYDRRGGRLDSKPIVTPYFLSGEWYRLVDANDVEINGAVSQGELETIVEDLKKMGCPIINPNFPSFEEECSELDIDGEEEFFYRRFSLNERERNLLEIHFSERLNAQRPEQIELFNL